MSPAGYGPGRVVTYTLCKTLTHTRISRGTVGLESVGTAFPHVFEVLLQNDFEAALKWLVFWVLDHTFFVSTASLRISCYI